MKYLVTFSAPQGSFRTATERFLKTGAKPPDGVTQLGRWFGMNGKGCAVLEAADPKGVFEMLSEWRELIEIDATPVLEDDEAGAIMAKLYG
ncbi:DUF3303 domain-containing protein [Mycobacterium sp.]|jgi:hypothetical protein|uniref:DUF3303 domain-containing protein n=1 Tax=Mycobacterium sp. TaxID=1785 RepID=UPI002D5BF3A4|nr:DUF3303 family protein [Mycobacterium sp.]HZA09498.1 DUF3303 family protein [Mycobacterium sp.]